jgi:hypothetical protein
MTQLEMVNKILLRLREDQVQTVAQTDYSKLIAAFVNDAKADLEDINHTWSQYEVEIDIAILADGTRYYDLPETNDRSFLLRHFRPGWDKVPMAFDVTENEKAQLFDAPLKVVNRTRDLTNTIVDVERPGVFAIEADIDAGDGWMIQLLWGSYTARNWRMYWYVPQPDLLLDGTDDNTFIQLPNRPVELRALAYAINERELANDPASQKAWQRSTDSIAAALELDMQVQKKSDEIDITNLESL